MTSLEQLTDTLVDVAMTPHSDAVLLRSTVLRTLRDARVVAPGPNDEVHYVPRGWTTTSVEPGKRAIIVPEFPDAEVQAMAGCLQLLDGLHEAADMHAVRRAIGWLSQRMSADELDSKPVNRHEEPF
jgi:hypothetical protein